MLIIALSCTMTGKAVVVVRHEPTFLPGALLQAVVPDFVFFLLAALFIRFLFIVKPCRFVARLALLIAFAILSWSVIDMGWMLQSGVQLQPGVFVIVMRDLGGLLPYLKTYVVSSILESILIVLFILAGLGFVVWKFLHPAKIVVRDGEHLRMVVAKLAIMMVLLVSGLLLDSFTQLGFAGEVMGFSGHWHAIFNLTIGRFKNVHSSMHTRNIPAAGEREVTLPDSEPEDMPNIVLVLLESMSYPATSLCDGQLDSTPFLKELAEESVEFELTRVPVPHTTKSYWAALTGSMPVIQADYAEAIPADKPYEGLASILKRVGYRSAFFEMSRGTFECGPGFFKNLDFDWAWFKENLEDESADLDYFTGDDFRMIEPAMEWLGQDSSPALLMMITSVSHEPYDVPAWFAAPAETVDDKYLQTLRYTDAFVKRVFEELKGRGYGENTLFCVIGDHGTTFRSSTDFARWCPYEAVLRVPWLIYWPGHVEGGRKIDWPCSQLDVTPTILELLGFGTEKAGFEGRNAILEGDRGRRMYFSSWYSDSPMGFVEGDRKVIYWPYLNKLFEYDLGSDPGEENPVKIDNGTATVEKRAILGWQGTSQIVIDPRRHTEDFVYSHWRTFSSGDKAWAYYLP